MKGKYQLVHGGNDYLISSINYIAVRSAEKILCSKVLRKIRPTECTTATIELAEQCMQGVQINWSQFLLNELMDDMVDMQELLSAKFHYSWLLILISFVAWTPPNYQPMDILVEYINTKFQNLWDDKDNKRKNDTKIEFFLQGERLRQIMRKQYRLKPAMVVRYPFINFHTGPHNIILYPRNDPKKQALSTFFIIRDAYIEREIKN